MQLIRSSGSINVIEFLPGLIAVSVLFGTTSMLAVTITFERKGRSFERLLLAPVSINQMVLAKITGTILFGICNACIPVIFASFFVNLGGINWGEVLLAVFLIAVTSTLISLMVAVSAKEVFEAQMLSNLFRFPMLFLCGTVTAVRNLPVFIRPISYCLPLTYGTDILDGAITGTRAMPLLFCIFILIVFTVVLFVLGRYIIGRKWIL